MKRRRFYRGIEVELECGHTAVLPSSFYRLPDVTVAILLGDAIRSGVFCRHESHEVKPCCMIQRVLRTVRL